MPPEFFELTVLAPRLVAVAFVVALLFLRTPLAKLTVRILFARLRRRNADRYTRVRSALLRPLSFFFLAGTARAVLPLLSIPAPYERVAANVLSTLFLLAAFWTLYAAAGLVASLLLDPERAAPGKVDANAANYITIALKAMVFVFAIFAVLSRWVTDISGLVAGLGIGGLALALAAQDTAANLFGSIAIMVDKPFEIGDWVEFDGFAGTVVAVGLRSTKIRVIDQSILSVPNSKLASSIVSNGALRSSRRVAFHIGLVYATPAAAVAAFVEGVKTLLNEDPEVEPDSVLVAFEKFAASSLEVFIAYRTNPDYAEMLRVREKINLAILNMAREMEISMALPSISLYQETVRDGSEQQTEERHAD